MSDILQEILQVVEVQAPKEAHAKKVTDRRDVNSSRHHAESYIPEIVDLMLHSIQVDARARFSILAFLVLQYSLDVSVTRIVLLGIRDTWAESVCSRKCMVLEAKEQHPMLLL